MLLSCSTTLATAVSSITVSDVLVQVSGPGGGDDDINGGDNVQTAAVSAGGDQQPDIIPGGDAGENGGADHQK